MGCMQCLEQLDEYVFIEHRHPSVRAIESHLASCVTCRSEYDSMREAIALIPMAADDELASPSLSPDFERRLMEQLDQPVARAANAGSILKSPFWRLAFAATVLACMASAYMMLRFGNPPANVNLSPQELADVQAYAREMKKLRELESVFAANKLHYVSLYETDVESRLAGYLVYDLVGEQVHFFCIAAKPLNDNEVYVLWLLDADGNSISQRQVELNSTGREGTATLPLPEDLSILRKAVVTVEPKGQAGQRPTGEVRMKADY